LCADGTLSWSGYSFFFLFFFLFFFKFLFFESLINSKVLLSTTLDFSLDIHVLSFKYFVCNFRKYLWSSICFDVVA
jgi:hypothetical protein